MVQNFRGATGDFVDISEKYTTQLLNAIAAVERIGHTYEFSLSY